MRHTYSLDDVQLVTGAGVGDIVHPTTGDTHVGVAWWPTPDSEPRLLAFASLENAENVAHGLLLLVEQARAKANHRRRLHLAR